jgi:hypothetical protein
MPPRVTANQVSRPPRQLAFWRPCEEFQIPAEAEQQLVQLLAELLLTAAQRVEPLAESKGSTAT